MPERQRSYVRSQPATSTVQIFLNKTCASRLRLVPPTMCIADRLQVDEPVTTVPTIGFNVETLKYKNIKFQVRFCCGCLANILIEACSVIHQLGALPSASLLLLRAGVGPWWTVVHPAILEVLLPEYRCDNLRRR